MRIYELGKVKVVKGDRLVTHETGKFLTYARQGDIFFLQNNPSVVYNIEQVINPKTIRLDREFEGDSGEFDFRIIETPKSVKYANLLDAKYKEIQRLNKQVEIARGRYITTIYGQDNIYAKKLKEAQRFADDPTSVCPFLQSEAETLGIELKDLVAEVIYKDEQADLKLIEIEQIRLATNKAVKSMSTMDGITKLVSTACKDLSLV